MADRQLLLQIRKRKITRKEESDEPDHSERRMGPALCSRYFGGFEKSGPTLGAPVDTAIERAPFFPTARTAKKWLSVDTPLSTASPPAATNSSTAHRGSVVSRHKTSNPARS